MATDAPKEIINKYYSYINSFYKVYALCCMSNTLVHFYETLGDKDAIDDGHSTSKSTFLLKISLLEVGTRWNKKRRTEKKKK